MSEIKECKIHKELPYFNELHNAYCCGVCETEERLRKEAVNAEIAAIIWNNKNERD